MSCAGPLQRLVRRPTPVQQFRPLEPGTGLQVKRSARQMLMEGHLRTKKDTLP
jgi:hypothetical protein